MCGVCVRAFLCVRVRGLVGSYTSSARHLSSQSATSGGRTTQTQHGQKTQAHNTQTPTKESPNAHTDTTTH
jgi:hypothetical protein